MTRAQHQNQGHDNRGALHVNCICQKRQTWLQVLEEFEAVRAACPAIRELYIPKEDWPRFRKWHQERFSIWDHHTPKDGKDWIYDASGLVLALKMGYLGRMTSPVHRYLLESGRPKPTVTRAWRSSIRENWMFQKKDDERNRRCNGFLSRIVELKCAEWLEEAQGWSIECLEALGGDCDILAKDQDQGLTAFEVKFLGMSDADFLDIQATLRGEGVGGAYVPSAHPINRDIKKAKEQFEKKRKAGKQHQKEAVMVVIDISTRWKEWEALQGKCLKQNNNVWILTLNEWTLSKVGG